MSAHVGKRKLNSWIEAFLEYTEILPSPPLFRRWTAIAYIAAAMERKVWVRTMGSDLYPNLYTLLVGPSGIGKGKALTAGERILRAVPDLKIGPSDMTAAALIDALNEAVRRVVNLGDPPFVEFNSLTIISREFGVMIPAWENAFMNNLTDIYDGLPVDQKRRGRELHIEIPHPQINLLGACTPSYLNEVIPIGAWDQGFISRTIMVYSGDRMVPDPFAEEDEAWSFRSELYNELLHDLKSVAAVYGQMSFTSGAAEAIRAWIKAGQPPEPTHHKLRHYNVRRLAHLLKLCIVASISHSDHRVIEIEHYSEALNWLLEAEAVMPDIFKSMVHGGDSSAMEEAWNYVWTLYAKEARPIAEHRIIHFLKERVPAHAVAKILEVMIRARMLEVVTGSAGAGYKPTSRQARLEGGAPH
jgi:Protein of unknown function (DUF3987)